MHTRKKIYARPVLGVLLTGRAASDLQDKAGNNRIKLMVAANREVNIILYFFSLKDVNLKQRKISGYCWQKNRKTWLRQDFPFPDVLYIRCKVEDRYAQTYKELCSIITRNRGELITHLRFDKWRLYQVMSKDPVMRSYLPATRTARRPEDIERMLRSHKVIYLKSHMGRKGENVLRVEALDDGEYRYSFYRHGLLTAKSTSSFQVLLNVVNRFFQGKNFIIQQAIQLPKFGNKLIDMRAELQRNGNGTMEIVGISVRFGRPGSPITTHGDVYRFEHFFGQLMDYSAEQLERVRSACHNFLFSVYDYIDKNYGRYAEIGIDFALDPNNKIWFIEANSQSTKVSLNMAYGLEALYRYYKNVLEYARYLSQQSKRR